ncbi:hypothetical protein JAO76_04125 [Pontibacter sp. BT310]|uniref:Rod shape-determining protein MreD n=1 Tax=Pontibacter populi TaxID=890055 RepID=A0ABS6X8H7_9BACT|nr:MULTISPECIES: hypothetical protein [Pontibacter]MBJ6117364.1 hypothetical protein [Pontibacter sp. BT310]MBR0569789.1 hypothetical protein [Microvirga sp. STS03]MBW3364217.1 hypothetical protein [Pontibacter populi]
MNSTFGIRHIVQFILFVALQILLLDNLVLFSTGFCFIYIAFLLFLPIQINKVLLLFLGFIVGFTVDIFYDTMGIHAAASVLLAFLRPHILNLLTPRDGYDTNDSANLHVMGWNWFLTYAFILITVHHTAVFFLEIIRFEWFTLVKILLSTLFTGLVVVILQLLFFSVKGSKR